MISFPAVLSCAVRDIELALGDGDSDDDDEEVLQDRSARASRAFMLMNGAFRALLQAMHPYAKDAVRFRHGGLQIERKEEDKQRRRGKEKKIEKEEKKGEGRGREGARDGFDRPARSFPRALLT